MNLHEVNEELGGMVEGLCLEGRMPRKKGALATPENVKAGDVVIGRKATTRREWTVNNVRKHGGTWYADLRGDRGSKAMVGDDYEFVRLAKG